MTTHELIKKLTDLRSALDRETEFVRLITTISGRYEESLAALNDVLSVVADPNALVQNTNRLKGNINTTVNLIKEMSLPKVFIDINRAKEQLEGLNLELAEGEEGRDGLGNLINAMIDFQNAFEALIKDYTPAHTLQLIAKAQAVDLSIVTTINLVDLLIAKLETPVEVLENEQTLSLLFPSTSEYSDVITKLNALSGTYSELCALFKVSTSEYPLRIIKLETGTLWLYVLGNALVIPFMVWLLKAAVRFIYRNFTTEGKITFIPREVDAADTVLQFSNKLQEAGVDTTQAKEEVNKALVKIAQNLGRLVTDQPSIEINNENLSVGDAYEEKFLTESRQLLLEDGSSGSKVDESNNAKAAEHYSEPPSASD